MLELLIRREHLALIVEHARRDYPREACGLIGGRIERSVLRADIVIPVNNVAALPLVRFEMDRPAMVKAILDLQRARREVVAIYHSHPTSDPRPSPSDILEASWPDAIYLIVGLLEAERPRCLAWTIRGGRAEPAHLTVLEEG